MWSCILNSCYWLIHIYYCATVKLEKRKPPIHSELQPTTRRVEQCWRQSAHQTMRQRSCLRLSLRLRLRLILVVNAHRVWRHSVRGKPGHVRETNSRCGGAKVTTATAGNRRGVHLIGLWYPRSFTRSGASGRENAPQNLKETLRKPGWGRTEPAIRAWVRQRALGDVTSCCWWWRW